MQLQGLYKMVDHSSTITWYYVSIFTAFNFSYEFFPINCFQYHGGTNFGRTAGGPFIATSYDYDAPIDEYGMCAMASLL